MEYPKNKDLEEISREWIKETIPMRYSYRFDWMGVQVIQFPQDLMGIQELIWENEPSIIIETGVAHGGLTMFLANMQHLVQRNGEVIAIEKGVLPETRQELEYGMYGGQISLIEGDSTSAKTLEIVKDLISPRDTIMVILDSAHTHDHVLKELQMYSELVGKGQYIVVMDTIIEFMPDECWEGKEYGVGNNSYTAVREFLKTNDRFIIDEEVENKLGITCAPGGWLKCVK